jgi:hypothetical protein
MCTLFFGCCVFESWMSWTNHSVCGKSCGDPFTSWSTTHQHPHNTNSAAPSPTWLDNDITLTWQRPCRHDSVATSCHCPHQLGSVVTSMTWGLGAYFPENNLTWRFTIDQAQGLEEYFIDERSDSGGSMSFSPTDDLILWLKRVPLQPIVWLGHTGTYITSLN